MYIITVYLYIYICVCADIYKNNNRYIIIIWQVTCTWWVGKLLFKIDTCGIGAYPFSRYNIHKKYIILCTYSVYDGFSMTSTPRL